MNSCTLVVRDGTIHPNKRDWLLLQLHDEKSFIRFHIRDVTCFTFHYDVMKRQQHQQNYEWAETWRVDWKSRANSVNNNFCVGKDTVVPVWEMVCTVWGEAVWDWNPKNRTSWLRWDCEPQRMMHTMCCCQWGLRYRPRERVMRGKVCFSWSFTLKWWSDAGDGMVIGNSNTHALLSSCWWQG
jgi:hypothetical protein